jgi:hypothetical protein
MDHRLLTYIQHQTDLPTTIANWTETILSYHFTCVYRPGLLNIIPDALSRAFPDELWSNKPSDQIKHLNKKHHIAAVNTQSGLRKYTQANQSTAPLPATSQQLASRLRKENIDPTIPYVHQIQTADQEQIVPDEQNRFHHLKTAHGFAHLGANAMVNALHVKGITWPKLKEQCLQFI